NRPALRSRRRKSFLSPLTSTAGASAGRPTVSGTTARFVMWMLLATSYNAKPGHEKRDPARRASTTDVLDVREHQAPNPSTGSPRRPPPPRGGRPPRRRE